MAQEFKLRNIVMNESYTMNTTEMVKYARKCLKRNHEMGVDKEIKSSDFNKSINAWAYLVNLGIGINDGQKWNFANGKSKIKIERKNCNRCGASVKIDELRSTHDEGKLCHKCYSEWCGEMARCDNDANETEW